MKVAHALFHKAQHLFHTVLVNRRSGRCLDAANPSSAAPPRQAVLQQWRCIHYADDWNAGNQLWRIGNENYL